MRAEAETEIYKSENPENGQPAETLERGVKHSPPEALERAWSYQDFDFRLLASKTEREYISVVLSHSAFATLLQQP